MSNQSSLRGNREAQRVENFKKLSSLHRHRLGFPRAQRYPLCRPLVCHESTSMR